MIAALDKALQQTPAHRSIIHCKAIQSGNMLEFFNYEKGIVVGDKPKKLKYWLLLKKRGPNPVTKRNMKTNTMVEKSFTGSIT